MSHSRSVEDKKRLKKLYDATKNGYGAGAYYDKSKKRIIRYSISDHSKHPKYLKRRANKAVRKSDITMQRNGFKKLYEYLWELY